MQFTKMMEKVFDHANRMALSHNHEYLLTDDILWAMCEVHSGAFALLEPFIAKIKADLKEYIRDYPNRPGITYPLPWSNRVQRLMLRATEEAELKRHNEIWTTDVLRGMLKQDSTESQIPAYFILNKYFKYYEIDLGAEAVGEEE